MPDLPEEIVTKPEELAACCDDLAALPHFGFDTEFVGEDTYHPHLCLVQVATAERLFLIDPLSAGPLDAFWHLVVDPARVVVVHAGREEVRLCRLWTGKHAGQPVRPATRGGTGRPDVSARARRRWSVNCSASI